MATSTRCVDASELSRFQAKVVEFPDDGCHVWIGGKTRVGYGQMKVYRNGQRKDVGVHRLAYEHWNGPIPPRMMVCHRCDQRDCVNPRHLFLGTNEDNMRDMKNKGRSARGQRNGQSRLREEQVRRIKARLKLGEPDAALGREFGVTRETIGHIRRGMTWAHLDD